jgi:hypothetical protein
MTAQTRLDIITSLRSRPVSCDCGDYCGWCHPELCFPLDDELLMKAYLSDYASESSYRREASTAVEFMAVLATEEYHRYWKE